MNLLSVYPAPLISYTHDASATILSHSGDQYAYEEEKLSRFQYAISDFPEKSAILGLKTLGLNPTDIDLLVLTSMNHCDERADYSLKVEYIKDLLSLRQNVKVECVPHHLAHSGLAVLTSPFQECIFLTMDGGGDDLMGHWGIFKDNNFEIVENFELSPAILYAYITCLTGFSLFEEGKVMGLSSYGSLDDSLYEWLKQNFWIERNQASVMTSNRVTLRWESALKPELADPDTLKRHKYFRLGIRFHDNELAEWLSAVSPADVAFTGQRFFEDLTIEAVSNIIKRTSINNIALGGGAFQNIVLNGKLSERTGLNTYVSMAPHDAGLSLGAGLFVWHKSTRRRSNHTVSPFLGPAFKRAEIEELIQSFSLSYERPDDLCSTVAGRIAEGKVVGWFQGRAEFGARALGARSVLADPRDAKAKAKVNRHLKKRDWFMPYAPSILEEHGNEYFENFSPSPYMNNGFRVKRSKIDTVPSAVHVDGSCRAHTVNENLNPKYYQLLKRFYAITGVPMILNTSFNRHGVPIVATPRQAIQHLLEGNVDLLAIDEFIVYREYLPSREPPVHNDEYHIGWANLAFSGLALKRGHQAAAQRTIDKLGLQIRVTPRAFESEGKPFWLVTDSEEDLRLWWDHFWE